MNGVAGQPEPGGDPGWLPDPWGVADRRWWNGSSWTESTWPTADSSGNGQRSSGIAVWGLIVVVSLAAVGLTVVGFLTYTGEFDEPKLGHVVEVKPSGDVCIRSDSGKVYCVENSGGVKVKPGDCVEVYDRHGIQIDRRIACPR